MSKACDMKRMTFALLMLVSISCASPARQTYVGHDQTSAYLRIGGEWGGEWNGLKLGMTKDDARRLLGKPYQVNYEGEAVGEFWCYEPCGYVTFSDGTVSGWRSPSEFMCDLLRPS